jgi:hypothetical protein
MADRWFYAHDDKKIGPFSGRQLRDLADSREILPTDTVWKEGIDQGVFATKVRYLFSSTQTETPPESATVQMAQALVKSASAPLTTEAKPTPTELKSEASPDEWKLIETLIPDDPAEGTLADDIELRPEDDAPIAPKKKPAPQFTPRKRRALAVKGAIIVSQDGSKVRFRKKCATCNHEETSWSVLPITDGMMRALYFCPKCRKKGEVLIRGTMI